MAIKSLLSSVVIAVLAVTFFPATSSAQHRPHHRHLRWLGQGFGDGYNRCNPGLNSDYYNPYSAHNTFLVSQSPRFSALLWNPQQLLENGTIRQGVPFAIYAAPRQAPAPIPASNPQFNNSFEPIKPARANKKRNHPLEFFRPIDDRNE